MERPTQHDGQPGRRLWTVPNFLSGVRLAGSAALIMTALWQAPGTFLLVYLVLALTDWADGKIAVRWKQRSVLGARLDSAADAAMYGCVLIGSLILWHRILAEAWPWIAAALASYGCSQLLGKIKFGRFVVYHTRTAKMSWLFLVVAVTSLALHRPDVPSEVAAWTARLPDGLGLLARKLGSATGGLLRLAMLSVTLANLEACLVTWLLPRWQADVRWFGRAWRIRQETASEGGDSP